MARVEKGNSLDSIELQPGWTIEDDGFGLLTCSATFKGNHGTSTGKPGKGSEILAKAPSRGDKFPQDERLICHRASSVADANGIVTHSADYVGIAQGTMTKPQTSGRFSSNQEPISTHPSFQKLIGGTPDEPKNGAVFNEDGSFKRFADPGYDQFYGITSYLSCGFAITGHFYTSQLQTIITLKQVVGETSSTGSFGGIPMLGELAGLATSWITEREDDQLLLTGVAFEYFGNLIKVSYDIMYSKDGWNGTIYGRREVGKVSPSQKSSTWSGKGTYYTSGVYVTNNRTSAW